MPNNPENQLQTAAAVLRRGGVVITPTEGVYGISCRCDCEDAIKRIIALKVRDPNKGLIVAADSQERAASLADFSVLKPESLELLKRLWPGPHTFVLPCLKQTSSLLTGNRHTLAVRVTAFAPLRRLIELTGCALVSTSANISGQPPLTDYAALNKTFGSVVDFIINAPCGGQIGPSSIHDAQSGRLLRPGAGICR